MRRDILAGALGFAAAAIMLYFKQGAPAYKKVEYSPFLFKPELPVSVEPIRIHPASGLIHSTTEASEPTKGNTYTVPTVNDIAETPTVDELMQLPLESAMMLDDAVISTTTFTKYVRFTCTKVRNSEAVYVGGFRFLYYSVAVPFDTMQIWNPHTGETKGYRGEPWSDSDQRSIIFCFREPVELSRYELKSSFASENHDPIQWKLEGSMNGGFWFDLDDRTKGPTAFPYARNTLVSYLVRGTVA